MPELAIQIDHVKKQFRKHERSFFYYLARIDHYHPDRSKQTKAVILDHMRQAYTAMELYASILESLDMAAEYEERQSLFMALSEDSGKNGNGEHHDD